MGRYHFMRIIRLSFSILSLFFVSISLLAHTAAAQDTPSFIDVLKKQAEANGNELVIGSQEQDGNRSIVRDFQYTNETENLEITVNELILTGFSQVGDKGFSVNRLEANGFTQKSKTRDGKDTVLSIDAITADNVDYPDLADRKTAVWPLSLGDGQFANVTLTTESPKEKQELRTPGINITGLEAKDNQTFSVETLVLEALSGTTSAPNGNYDLTLDGITLDNATLISATAFDIALLEIGKFNLEGTNEEGHDIAFALGKISARNLYSPDWSKPVDSILPETGINIAAGPAELKLDGKTVFGWNKLEGSSEINDERSVMQGSGAFSRAFVNLDALPVTRENKRGLDAMTELGYERLVLDLTGDGTWNIKTGDLSLGSYRLDIDDVGSIEMVLKASGYTEAVARKVSQLSHKSSLETDPEKQSAISLQILGELAGLTLEEAQLSVTDDSALQRVIKLQSQKTGQDAQSYQTVIPFLASSMLGPYNVPELAAQVRDALGVFMQGNRSIDLRLAPVPPLTTTQIIALGAGVRAGSVQPDEIVKRLNITVNGR